MKPPPFAYHDPETAEEALALLAALPGAKLLAGGQSLMPMLNMRYVQPDALIDLRRVRGLDAVETHDGHLRIGATVRQRALERSAEVARHFPLMREALRHVGHLQTRNRGTIGGSICHLDPAAELPLVALALDGEAEILGRAGTRMLPMAELPSFYMTPAIEPDELLTAVHLPFAQGRRGAAFEEVARRHGDFAIVAVAVVLDADEAGRIARARIAVGGAGPVPQRARAAEAALEGRAARADALAVPDEIEEIEAAGDAYCTEAYRRSLARTLCARALSRAAAALETAR